MMARWTLEAGQTFTLDDNDDAGRQDPGLLPHPEILEAVQPGHRLLIDDGRLQLLIVESADDDKSIVTAKWSAAPRFPTGRA
jgi:pyruvate kinase